MSDMPKVIFTCPEDADREYALEWKPHMGPWVRYIRADAPELVALVEAINAMGRAFDKARMVARPGSGIGGMTIEDNIRGSVYNGVDAWPIEDARAALAQWEALQ